MSHTTFKCTLGGFRSSSSASALVWDTCRYWSRDR